MEFKPKILTPFKRAVIQQFPFIEEDFDALTNYGLLCKIVEYLNNLLESQNDVNEQTVALTNAFNELKAFVDDYFDNLDVQVEINNKLDQMVETGEFQTLLDQVITPAFNSFKEGVNQTLNNFEVKLNSVASGAPIPVDSTSAMTDTTRIYLLTTSGHWYYYNGSVWTDGGVYQATAINDNSVIPNKLSQELRDKIGYQYINEVSAANTVKNYYYPFDFEVGRTYKFKLVGAGVQYINEDVIKVESVDDNNTLVEAITKIVNNAATVITGTFIPSASATKIHVRTHSYQECTVSFEIEKQIELDDLSNQSLYNLGQPFDQSTDYGSNTDRSWSYPYGFKAGETYNVRVTNTGVQFVSAPTMSFGTLDTPVTGANPTYIDTIESYNSYQPYSKSFMFTPTTDANYLGIYIHNYMAGTFTIHVEKLSSQYINNPIATVVTNPRTDSDDYARISDAVTDGASAILVLNGVFTETIGTRGSLLPDIIGISNNCSVINRATGAYATPPIQCAQCHLLNLKLTETYDGDDPHAYCLHIDHENSANTTSIIENCKFENNKFICAGIGMFEGQEIIFRNCDFSNSRYGVYMHNGGGNYSGLAKLKFIDCTFDTTDKPIFLQDYNGNGAVEFTFIGCNIKTSQGIEPVTIEYKNYGDGTSSDNTWAHKFSLSANSYGNNISLLNA